MQLSLLKFVPATFFLVCFAWLKESTFDTRTNVFHFTSKALFVLEIIRFKFFRYSNVMTSHKHETRNTFYWITWKVKFLILCLGIWWCYETWISKTLKFYFLENKKRLWSEIKKFFSYFHKCCLLDLEKQTRKNVADTTFKRMDLLKTSMVLKCVPLTISDQLYFLRLSKVWSMLHDGSVGNKKCCTMFSYTFFLHFCCFSPLNLCFCHFNFFFWWSIKCPQRNISHWK